LAWNEPGGPADKDKDPWQRKKDKGPPDLDQIVKNIQNKLADLFGGKKGGGPRGGADGPARRIGAGLIAIIVFALWTLSGFYIIQQGERGVILRFGKRADVTGPGLHWHLPFPIEKRVVINVERPAILELGYRRNEKRSKEALMLTEDENIIDIEFAIRYKISNPGDYLFNISDPDLTISQAAESAVREVVGKNTLDFVITSGRAEVEQNTKIILQEMLDRYKSGMEIVGVEMQKALPPDEVKAAFDDAVKAREDEQRLKNEAEAYFNDVIPRARGAAARKIQEAQGYKASVIARAEGDAKRFSQIISEYAKAPAVTRERLYIEAIEHVFSTTSKIFVDQKSGGNMLYLPLDKLMPQAPASSTQPAQEPPEAAAPASEPARERSRERERKRGGQ
jgi:membrane protease subunit HflK